MNLLHGPAIADLCDYDFGDQAGCLGGVSGAFMKDANESNLDFIKKVNGNQFMTLFIDNIRLYKRNILCGIPTISGLGYCKVLCARIILLFGSPMNSPISFHGI